MGCLVRVVDFDQILAGQRVKKRRFR